MPCIKTEYKSAGVGGRGTRIVASCDAGRITVPYDHERDGDANHEFAAMELAARYGWEKLERRTAWFKGDGYHVFTHKADRLAEIHKLANMNPADLLAHVQARGGSAQTFGDAARWALGAITVLSKPE